MKSRARGAQLSRTALCVVCVAGALAWTSRADAYCRTMSCELGEDPHNPCPRDANQCVTKGNPLHWASPCLSYSVQLDGSARSKLDADQVRPLVEQAFNAWKSARCPGGGSPRFEVQFQSYVSCDRREVVCDDLGNNANVVMFHDSGWLEGAKPHWCHHADRRHSIRLGHRRRRRNQLARFRVRDRPHGHDVDLVDVRPDPRARPFPRPRAQ